jgi:hypothetical protein
MFALWFIVVVFVQSEQRMPNEFLLGIVTLILNGFSYNFHYFSGYSFISL